MSTETKRIQLRHGTYSDFQTYLSEMLPDETVIIDSGCPYTDSGSAIVYKDLAGNIHFCRNTDDAVGIQQGQIGEDELDTGAVTENKIAEDAVKTRHIADGQITKGKLSSDVQNQINNAMRLLPVKTSLSDLSDIEIGQLFLYNDELLRKRTATRYDYIKSMYSTGGTGIDSYSPAYIGQFILFNNELYVGKNTSTGGYQQISTTLTVNLTGDLDGFTADKTVYEIYQAIKAKRIVIFSLSMYGGYHTYNFEVGQINSDSETGELLVRIYNSYLNSVGENWRFVASGRQSDTNNAVFSVITD